MRTFLRIALWCAAGLAGLTLCATAVFYFFLLRPSENFMAFLEENPEKVSVTYVRNDSTLVDHRSDVLMPLASTVKIMVAVEYAKQAAAGFIDPDLEVSQNDLTKYYLEGTDGDAHPTWLSSLDEGPITLRDVAKGMILYSSNANTEFLCELLGLGQINATMDSLGLVASTDVDYIVAQMLINQEVTRGDVDQLKTMSPERYAQATARIHAQLKGDADYASGFDGEFLGLDVQQVWSDRLPASSTREYATFMGHLNRRDLLSEEVHHHLDEILEQQPHPSRKRFGEKGGSTGWVLTSASYITDVKGNREELAIFLNNSGGELVANKTFGFLFFRESIFSPVPLIQRDFVARLQAL